MLKGFAESQLIIESSLRVVELMQEINLDDFSPEAQEYLLSQLKKHTGILGSFIIRNEEKK